MARLASVSSITGRGSLGQLAGGDDEVEALLDGGGGEHDLGIVARGAEDSAPAGRPARPWSAGPVEGPPRWTTDDHQRDLGHHRQADELGLERQPRTGRDGARGLARVGGADRESDRRDLVLGLVQEAAHLVEAHRPGSATRKWPA